MSTAAPSPITKPSRSLSNGREAPRRIVVARGHRADDRERAEAERRERRLGAAGEHDVGVAVADRAEGVADRDRARRAAHRVRAVRPLRAELDRDVAARRAAEHAERERRAPPRAAPATGRRRAAPRRSGCRRARCPSSRRRARGPRAPGRSPRPRSPAWRTPPRTCRSGRAASPASPRRSRRASKSFTSAALWLRYIDGSKRVSRADRRALRAQAVPQPLASRCRSA